MSETDNARSVFCEQWAKTVVLSLPSLDVEIRFRALSAEVRLQLPLRTRLLTLEVDVRGWLRLI